MMRAFLFLVLAGRIAAAPVGVELSAANPPVCKNPELAVWSDLENVVGLIEEQRDESFELVVCHRAIMEALSKTSPSGDSNPAGLKERAVSFLASYARTGWKQPDATGGVGAMGKAPLPEGPLQKSGMRAGDAIIEIDGRPVGKRLGIEPELRGPAGSVVKLKVLRNGREKIELQVLRTAMFPSSKRAMRLLEVALRDPSAKIRVAAVAGLGNSIEDIDGNRSAQYLERTTEMLIPLLSDESAEVVELTKIYLRLIGTQKSLAALREDAH